MKHLTNLPKVLTNDFSPSQPPAATWEAFNLEDVDFEGVALDGITHKNAKWDRVFINTKECHIQNSLLENWRLDDCSFLGSRFTQTTLKNCTFLKTPLAFANFDKATIDNLNIIDSSLQGTVFTESTINTMVVQKNSSTTKIAFDRCQFKIIYSGLGDGNFIVKDSVGFVIFLGNKVPSKLFNKATNTAYFHIPDLYLLLKKENIKLPGKRSYQPLGEAYLAWLQTQTLETLTHLTQRKDAIQIDVKPGEVFPLNDYLYSLPKP